MAAESSSFLTLDYSYRGRPFIHYSATTSHELTTMDYSYRGRPFVGNALGSASTGVTPTTTYNAVIMGCNF